MHWTRVVFIIFKIALRMAVKLILLLFFCFILLFNVAQLIGSGTLTVLIADAKSLS